VTRKRINIKTNLCSKKITKSRIKELKKKINQVGKENIISIDESSIDTHINSHYGWERYNVKILKILIFVYLYDNLTIIIKSQIK
jgi:hypothetical protein